MSKRGSAKRLHTAATKRENGNESDGVKGTKRRRVISDEPTEFVHGLDTERLRGFKCPKKGEDGPYLESVPLSKPMYDKEILPIVERNFKTQERYHTFLVKQCVFLRNKRFENEYMEKRAEIRQNINTPKEPALNDIFGFVYAKNRSQIMQWCKEGLCNGNSQFSRLGVPQSGVSLSQHVDLVCPTPLPKEGWICLVKYFRGRAYHVMPTNKPLEPQPGYDCHVANSTAQFVSGRFKETVDAALNNHIYLYEYSDDAELVPRPRHVLPYAAIQYTTTTKGYTFESPDSNDSKGNRYRLLLQEARLNERSEPAPKKTFLNNRQHPGVPLMVVKPRMPHLVCRTTRDFLSTGGGIQIRPIQAAKIAPLLPLKSGITAAGSVKINDHQTENERMRSPKNEEKNAEKERCISHKTKESSVLKPGKKQKNKTEDRRQPQSEILEKQMETVEHSLETTQSHDQINKAQLQEEKKRPDRPAPNIGHVHFSGGFVVSVVRLKAGKSFQTKMELVSYSEKVVYPIPVRCRRLAPKLSVRSFVSMSSLLSNELADVNISLSEEFICSNSSQFASYYRFYLRSSTQGLIPMSSLCNYLRRRQRVAVAHFPVGNQAMLMFPDCKFASDIGIPPVTKPNASESTHFLHCLLLSDMPRHDYYSCLREPNVPSDVQCVDEVLSSYIWADMDLPPIDERDAQLQGSYGGVWPCVEAFSQLLLQMNDIQHQRLLDITRRISAADAREGTDRLAYQPLSFARKARPVVRSPSPETELERLDKLPISKQELQQVLASVELLEQQKQQQVSEAPPQVPQLGQPDQQSQLTAAGSLSVVADGRCVERFPGGPTPPSTVLRDLPVDYLRKDDFEEEVEERNGDWRKCKKDIHSGLGKIFRSIQETPSSPPPLMDCESHASVDHNQMPLEWRPHMVRYSKTVFEEPPASPVTHFGIDYDCTKDATTSPRSKLSDPRVSSSAMTGHLRRINAEMKEPGSTVVGMAAQDTQQERACFRSPTAEQQASSNACFGKMLNVIRNSLYDNQRAPKENDRSVDLPSESGAPYDDKQAFNAYEIQNRAAKEARERSRRSDSSNDRSPTEQGINDWYWSFYQKTVAGSKAATITDPTPTSNISVPSGWSGTTVPADKDRTVNEINDDEIHQILEEGICDEKGCSPENLSSQAPDGQGSNSELLPLNVTRELEIKQPDPISENSTATSVGVAIVKPSDGRRDLRFLRRTNVSLSPIKTKSLASKASTGTSPDNRQMQTEDNLSIMKGIAYSPSSSMSISSTDDAETPCVSVDADGEGSRIPVMVNRRLPGTGITSLTGPRPSVKPVPSSDVYSCLAPPSVATIPIPLAIHLPIGVPMTPISEPAVSTTLTTSSGGNKSMPCNNFYEPEQKVKSSSNPPSPPTRELVDYSFAF